MNRDLASHQIPGRNLIWTSISDKHSGLMKISTQLGHISHCITASGTNWSKRWIYRVFIIHTRRDQISFDAHFVDLEA